jgi:hypothetical protein
VPDDPNNPHARFCGMGGAQAIPSLMSRGVPRSMIVREPATVQGWELIDATGRGVMGRKGRKPKKFMLDKEEHLGEVPPAA